MSVSPILGSPKPQFLDSNGDPLSGGLLEFYASGTATPLDTYTSTTGATTNSNPIVLNARGEPAAQIHATDGTAYKAVLKDSAGATVWTIDVIYSVSSAVSTSTTFFLNATLEKNATYTVVAGDDSKLIRCTANTFTVTLLPAATATEGFIVTVTNDGDGIITVDADASELINGVTTVTLQPGENIILTCTGTAWNGPRYIKGVPLVDGAGTVDAITADFTPNFTLTDGAFMQVKAVGQITSTTPSLAVDGLAAKTIVKENDKALELHNISGSGQTLLLQYDATLDKHILLNPTQLSFIMLATPEVLSSGLGTGSWVTHSSTTLSTAKAKYALLRFGADDTTLTVGGDVGLSGEFYVRKTGSAFTNNIRTRVASFNENLSNTDVGEGITFSLTGESTVELDSSYDFDYYLSVSGFTAYTTDTLYLLGYYS